MCGARRVASYAGVDYSNHFEITNAESTAIRHVKFSGSLASCNGGEHGKFVPLLMSEVHPLDRTTTSTLAEDIGGAHAWGCSDEQVANGPNCTPKHQSRRPDGHNP
jgi:hypothetical protein